MELWGESRSLYDKYDMKRIAEEFMASFLIGNGACHGYISTERNSAGGIIGWWNGEACAM